jgi:hypothetical protein
MTLPHRRVAALLVALVLGASAGCASTHSGATAAPPPTTAAPAIGFVTRSAATLTVDGKPWRFAGYNLPCANPFVMQEAELSHYLDVIQQDSGANVIRAWFFQSNGGPANWAPFDRVVAALKSHGMRVVATLTDEWNGGCDAGAGAEKDIDWYRDNYRQPDTGHAISYRDFAIQVAAHYAGEPAIALWELVNEAQADTRDPSGQVRCDNDAGQKALRTFADDMTGAIKAVDNHHLVSLGTIGGNQCGLAGTAAYQHVHAGLVDMCEYHDYGVSAAPLPGGADQLAQRLHDCATLPGGPKPLFVGEAGIQGNVRADGGPAACKPWPGCSDPLTPESLTRRAAFFEAKIKAAISTGAVGYIVWVKSPYYSPSGDMYAIGDGDPSESALKSAAVASPG